MINASNIAAYIRFLYQQKYQTPAPEEVVSSWSDIPQEEIELQLSALYQHWGLGAAEAQAYERTFLNQDQSAAIVNQAYRPPVPPQRPAPVYTPPPAPSTYDTAPPRRGNAWSTLALVLIIVLLAAGGLLAVRSYQNQQQSSATTASVYTDTDQEAPGPVAAAPEPEPLVPDLPVTEADDTNMNTIHALLTAEDEQNLEQVLSYYAPNMEKYWDIDYPTPEQLQKRYEDTWQKIADAQNNVQSIRKIAPNTYDANIRYHYYFIPKDTTRTVKSTIRFVFNGEHQVTQVYKLK